MLLPSNDTDGKVVLESDVKNRQTTGSKIPICDDAPGILSSVSMSLIKNTATAATGIKIKENPVFIT